MSAKLISLLSACFCVYLILKNTVIKNEFIKVLASLALIGDHWFRLAAGSGMEASFTALLTLFLGLKIFDLNKIKHTYSLCGLLSGLLILSRPEFFIFPAIFLLCNFKAGLKNLTRFIFPLLSILTPWIIYSQISFGSIIPNTVAIKISSAGAGLIPEVSAIITAFNRQLLFFGSQYLIEITAIIASIIIAKYKKFTEYQTIPLSLWCLILFLPALYFVTHARGGESVSYRYAAPILPLLVLIGFSKIEELLVLLKFKQEKIVLISVTSFILICGASLSYLHLPALKKSQNYLEGILIRYAEWLTINTPDNSLVACYDVGALAYFSNRPILDLIGLNNPEVLPNPRPAGFSAVNIEAIKKYKPDYLVTFAQYDARAQYQGLPIKRKIFSEKIESYRFGESTASFGYSELIELDWERRPNLGPVS